jgi:ATP-dependent RNA helicase CshB
MGIIFCNTKESCDSVYNWMKDRNENVTVFHGDIDYRKRKQIIKRINNLEFQYIVATDILARGIDIVGVSHIINFELPRDFEFYIHRSGRTGRIDFDGVCLSLYEFNDNSYLDKLENKGVKCEYKAIRSGMIVDASIRKSREKRVRPENELDYEAKRKVKKPKKIKPAYKKKYQEAVNKEKKKLARKKR